MLTTPPPIPPAYVQQVEDDCIRALRGTGLPAHFVEIKKGDQSFTILEAFPQNIRVKVVCSFGFGITFQSVSVHGVVTGQKNMQIDYVEERVGDEGPIIEVVN